MTRTTRRHFLLTSAATAASVAFIRPSLIAHVPSDKLRLGVGGVSGRGGANLSGVRHEEIAALCDVAESRLDGAMKRHPKAGRFVDFRKMLDEVKLDGVVVSTADHTHAVIGLAPALTSRRWAPPSPGAAGSTRTCRSPPTTSRASTR